MKNLLKRMKDEPLAKLNEKSAQYPSTYSHIVNDLKANEFVMDLKFNTVWHLNNDCIAKSLTLTSMTELFND
jgi:hypothetical protein